MRITKICIISCAFIQTLSAQSLPNIQTESLRLPAETKIDGKLSEWPGSLQAYNKATRLEYTIANDDKKLYLAIRSGDKTTTAKILAGGITFTLNMSSKNRLDNAIITFPLTNSTYNWDKGWPEKNFRLLSDSSEIRNALMQLKEIKILRFKNITDSLLSIYNPYGIKSIWSYSNERLICELSIPFDLIGLSLNAPDTFSYYIKLNGVPFPTPPADIQPKFPPPVLMPPGIITTIIESEIRDPTDFSGKYTLSIK